MLTSIKKEFNKIFNTAQADKEVKMKKEAVQPSLANPEMAAQLEAATTALAAQANAFTALEKEFKELSSKFESVQSALNSVEQAKEALIVEAKAAKLASRKNTIEMSVGTGKADALLVATENLDDVSFEAVVSAMSASFKQEAVSPLFTEIGVDAVADTAKVVEAAETSAEAKILSAKYKTKSKGNK